MKKYSDSYFEKKFRILFDKLLSKEGFLSEVQEARKELGIPDGGFENETALAYHFINKTSDNEWFSLSFTSFIEAYEQKHKIRVSEGNKKDVIDAFLQEERKKEGKGIFEAMYKLDQDIQNHTELFTSQFSRLFPKNKFYSQLSPKVFSIINTFWGYDLLDEHITMHFVEKYLFLGDYGVDQYIKSKVACTNCRYIGVHHFSPERHNMQGKDQGVYSKGYIFNKATVKQLSQYFNSIFLIIKPYATKEQVLNYVEDNWNDLKEHVVAKNGYFKQFDVHPSKIKESDFERNKLIYELHKLQKKELIKMYEGEKDFNRVGVYKEMVISSILKEKHGIDMTSDAIKKAATRFAKSAKLKKEPRDIRDI